MSETVENPRDWARDQIRQYRDQYPRYAELGRILQQILEKAARQYAPLAIIQTRPKSYSSFAEKILRKRKKYTDPLLRMTDLCGGRVITETQSEVEVICRFLEDHFVIDGANSLDVSGRLRPTEFGYRSVHYIVQLKPGVFPTREIAVTPPDSVFPSPDCPMKAEIQVRTVLEHSWASFSHDIVYKGEFPVPSHWVREMATTAGLLEAADHSFSRTIDGLRTYAANYGAYMSPEMIREELELLDTVLECDPKNYMIGYRIGKLAITLGDWEKAVDVLGRFTETGYPPILRDLGVALCKTYGKNRDHPRFREGQNYLEAATAEPLHDPDALASLAGTWKGVDEAKVREYYRRAYELDPTDPYGLSNYLVCEIVQSGDYGPVRLLSPLIRAAIQRCQAQIEVGMNLPWAYYNLGMFHLLAGQSLESLAAYARAIQASPHAWMIETSLRLLEKLRLPHVSLPGWNWAQQLLLAGQAMKSISPDAVKPVQALASSGKIPLQGPVVILAGDCGDGSDARVQAITDFVASGFRNFRGTLISGGTTAGISGLAGSLQARFPNTLTAVGYTTKELPAGASLDKRYREIRRTPGTTFSAAEPIQYWIDLAAAGVRPDQIILLGFQGGPISDLEYRIALALGTKVGLLADKPQDPATMLPGSSGRLFALPFDPVILELFLEPALPPMEPNRREKLAEAIHLAYCADQAGFRMEPDPARVDWKHLPDNLKESNRRQADHIQSKMARVNRKLTTVSDQSIPTAVLPNEEVELLAELEHARWFLERMEDGWVYAEERNIPQKTSPYLVPWSALPEAVKELDRQAVRRIPGILAASGLMITSE